MVLLKILMTVVSGGYCNSEPFYSFPGASIVIGKAAIATDSCSNELEEVRKNLGKKPGWSSSERDEQFASGLNSKPPLLPTARTSASGMSELPQNLTNIVSSCSNKHYVQIH